MLIRRGCFTDREIAEYRALCAALGALTEKYALRKAELRAILEKTAVARRDALLALVKANRLTRHLTGGQRRAIGLAYNLSEIQARVNQMPQTTQVPSVLGEQAELSAISPQECRDLRELKQREILTLTMIDGVKKKLLQLDILELRCRELMLSIDKAMEAFVFESNIIRRNIYPLGIFSLIRRKIHHLFGGAYFALRDLEDIAALGSITGNVLKIADSQAI